LMIKLGAQTNFAAGDQEINLTNIEEGESRNLRF